MKRVDIPRFQNGGVSTAIQIPSLNSSIETTEREQRYHTNIFINIGCPSRGTGIL